MESLTPKRGVLILKPLKKENVGENQQLVLTEHQQNGKQIKEDPSSLKIESLSVISKWKSVEFVNPKNEHHSVSAEFQWSESFPKLGASDNKKTSPSKQELADHNNFLNKDKVFKKDIFDDETVITKKGNRDNKSVKKISTIDEWDIEVIKEKGLKYGKDASDFVSDKSSDIPLYPPKDSELLEESAEVKTLAVNSFEYMGLNDDILKGIYSYGFEKPSQIQRKAIPSILTKRDTIVQSQSGTGKTGSFAISTMQLVDLKDDFIQILVLSPTQALAEQTLRVFKELGRYTKINIIPCIGGTDINEFISRLNKNTQHIAIGTPGRVLHMADRGIINLKKVKVFVLDEADELLERGFFEQINKIMTHLPGHTMQMVLVSATLPEKILEITKKFMLSPIRILIQKEQLTLEGIKQYYVIHKRDNMKLETLLDLYTKISISQTIIYANTRKTVDWLKTKLEENNYPVAITHKDCDDKREVLQKFRKGDVRILIATDIIARGFDVQQVSLVVNYDLPNEKEQYIHRIGRSGRFGRKGIAINLITEAEWVKIEALQIYYNTKIEMLPENFNAYFQ
jgi:translation initiation factor 4A